MNATIDLTQITAPLTPYVDKGQDPHERTAEISDAWWEAARAAGLRHEDVNVSAYCYDEHVSVDSVKLNGEYLEDEQIGEVVGYSGQFFLIVADGATARALPVPVNRPCVNCGGEIDLGPEGEADEDHCSDACAMATATCEVCDKVCKGDLRCISEERPDGATVCSEACRNEHYRLLAQETAEINAN